MINMRTEMSGAPLENSDLSPILVIAFAENTFHTAFWLLTSVSMAKSSARFLWQ